MNTIKHLTLSTITSCFFSVALYCQSQLTNNIQNLTKGFTDISKGTHGVIKHSSGVLKAINHSYDVLFYTSDYLKRLTRYKRIVERHKYIQQQLALATLEYTNLLQQEAKDINGLRLLQGRIDKTINYYENSVHEFVGYFDEIINIMKEAGDFEKNLQKILEQSKADRKKILEERNQILENLKLISKGYEKVKAVLAGKKLPNEAISVGKEVVGGVKKILGLTLKGALSTVNPASAIANVTGGSGDEIAQKELKNISEELNAMQLGITSISKNTEMIQEELQVSNAYLSSMAIQNLSIMENTKYQKKLMTGNLIEKRFVDLEKKTYETQRALKNFQKETNQIKRKRRLRKDYIQKIAKKYGQ